MAANAQYQEIPPTDSWTSVTAYLHV